MNSKNNSQDSQENSEVRRNGSSEITAIHIIYNENEKEKGINATGIRKGFITANEINPEEEVSIPAFDSRENEVILPQSLLNEMAANGKRRMTPSAVRKREKQRNDNSMQK